MSISPVENYHLDKLLTTIETIIDIDSVYVSTSGTYEISYGPILPNENEAIAIQNILDNWDDNRHRYDLIDQINENYDSNLVSGFTVPSSLLASDPTGGWKLPVDTESVSILNLQLVLAQINNTENISISDSAGNIRTLPLNDLKLIMTPYSEAAATVRQNRAQSIYNINQTYNSYVGAGDIADINP